MNKCVLVGRLTADPTLKFGQGSGIAVCNITLAVNKRFKKEGQPDADFINIVCFNKTAENVANFMTKGKLVSLAGSISTRNYEAKDGHRIYVTEVIADEINFLDKKDSSQEASQTKENEYEGATPIDTGEIPF